MLPIVRVPWNDAVIIKRVLDAGAETLLVPFVQDATEAAAAVAATRYPPQGMRGMAAMSRASRFGTVPDHFVHANTQIGVILQIETPTALANLEAIAAVPGVDALFLGPGDLSGTMGLPGQVGHPDVVAAMHDAARRARAVGQRIGTVMGSVEQVQQMRDAGYRLRRPGVGPGPVHARLHRRAEVAARQRADDPGQLLVVRSANGVTNEIDAFVRQARRKPQP